MCLTLEGFYFKLKDTHAYHLSLCRALYMCGEDAVQPAVHPGPGCSVDQVQPRGKTGLEHIWSTYEGKGEITFHYTITNNLQH